MLWLAIQLVAIGLAAARVPFFADYPQQGEFQAPRILLVVQWLGIAALFPILLPDLRGVVWIVASSVVMLAFAGALAAEPLLALAPAGIYSILYVVVVFGWSRIARSMRAKMILSAILVTSLVGGPILAYLREDLSAQSSGGAKWKLGVLWALLKDVKHPAFEGWIVLLATAGLAGLLVFLPGISHLKRANHPR
ncbi:MAG TPA: hypothetical protein VIM11_16220 [Tepidisphaeraceae bacterium]